MNLKRLKSLLKNKKILVFLGIGLILLIVFISLIASSFNKPSSVDAGRFKNEFESFNKKESSEGIKLQKVSLSNKNKIVYTDLDGALNFLESGTGIIFFASPDDPTARSVVNCLLDAMDSSKVEKVLYLDMREILDEYELRDTEVKKLSTASPKYYSMVTILKDYLEDYYIKDLSTQVEYSVGVKRLSGPTLVAVKKGYVLNAHTGSVDLKENQTEYDELDFTEKAELKIIYENIMAEVEKEA